MDARRSRRLCCCITLLALCAGCSERDIESDTADIVQRAPLGAAFDAVPGAMKALGYDCRLERNPFTGPRGDIRPEPYLACVREIPYLWICHRRTRAFAVQLRGRLSDVLVNSAVFCL